MAAATVKQRIFDLLAASGGTVITTEQLRARMKLKTRREFCALSANLTQMYVSGVVMHPRRGGWKLARGAVRPLGRNQHPAQKPKAPVVDPVEQTIFSAAINALILAPVVRI